MHSQTIVKQSNIKSNIHVFVTKKTHIVVLLLRFMPKVNDFYT